MSKVLKRRWSSELIGAGLSRRHTRSCEYEVYIPDQLRGQKFSFDGDVAADIADAETSITRLNATATALVDTEALARILLRAEAVASSRIEGLEIGARRLLHAEAARSLPTPPADVTATEVLGNIDAMLFGVDRIGPGDKITIDLLLEVHKRLLAGTRLDTHAGKFRNVLNWIGGSDYNPCSAAFIPPPPEIVRDLMADLCEFSNSDDLPAVAQAAIAHAQFETIHPFIDGNGRTGRTLIYLVLRRRGLIPRVLPPVSVVLATRSRSYIDGLTRFRYIGSASSSAAIAGVNSWVATFAGACRRACDDAAMFESRSEDLEKEWRSRLGSIRSNSAVDLLLRRLLATPVLTATSAASLIGTSFKPANDAIERLVEVNILRQVTIGRRNRAFEAPSVIEAFTALERQLSTNTAVARKSGHVQRGPKRK
ncbi:MAG: Fic family protein [Actinomycetota bacterium]